MARIRSIHPKLLTDESFLELTMESPLSIALLIGLWMEADDSGTFEWKPASLKARIIPAAGEPIAALLDVLAKHNFIRKFDLDGKPYGVVRNFVKFQRPKSPKDIYPFTSETRIYAGFQEDGKRPHSETGRPTVAQKPELIPKCDDEKPEGVPNEFGTTSEIARQRKEEGGRRKEELKTGPAIAAPFRASDPADAEPAIDPKPLDGEIIAPPSHPPNLAIVPKSESPEPIEACLRRLCCEGRRDPHPLILAHDFRPIFDLEHRPEITRGDIETGIRQAIQRGEKPNNGKPLDQWKSCVGWIETAARDRLASGFVRDGPRSAAQDQASREAEFYLSGRSTF